MRCCRLALWCLLVLPLVAGDDLPPGAGSGVVSRVCTVCHAPDKIRQRRLSRDGWEDIVDDMVDRGAKLTGEERETVLAYLAENFGPASKLRVNSAPLAEWKAVARLSVEEARAVLDYRQKNGDFHQIGDLLRVPGVDPQKIESKKDIFAF